MSNQNRSPGQQNQNPGQKPGQQQAAATSPVSNSRTRTVRVRTPASREPAAAKDFTEQKHGKPRRKAGFSLGGRRRPFH